MKDLGSSLNHLVKCVTRSSKTTTRHGFRRFVVEEEETRRIRGGGLDDSEVRLFLIISTNALRMALRLEQMCVCYLYIFDS